MNKDELKRQLKIEAEKLAEKIAEESSDSLQDMAVMERKIYAAMDQLKAKALQLWAGQAQDDSGRPKCPQCGGPMRHKGYRDKTSSCVGGQVTVGRKRWWCDACKASFSPSGRDDDGGRVSDHS